MITCKKKKSILKVKVHKTQFSNNPILNDILKNKQKKN